MTDARIPERWLMDRRLMRLSPEEFRLWVMGTVWSVSNRTDGHIERDDLPYIPAASGRLVAGLVTAGLWSEVNGGWMIVDFGRDQTSRDELERLDNIRRADREKKQRQRAAKANPVIPGDSPGDVSPGTAQARTGKDRTGKEGEEMGPSSGEERTGMAEWHVVEIGKERKAS